MVGPQAVWVEGPPAEPRPYGLFTAAQVVEDAEPRWLMGGARHEVDYCGEAYDSAGVCFDFGTLAVTINTTRQATLDLTGYPVGDYAITWGDEDEGESATFDSTPDGATHTYAANGPYTITVTGPRSYQATAAITVTNGATTGGSAAAAAGVGKQTHTGVDVVEGDPFVVLHLLECAPVGFGEGTTPLPDRAREALRMGEQRAVERVVGRALARDERAVVLASGDLLHAVDALAALEVYAAANYPGRPTIHATPDVVTLWDHFGVVTMRTVNGVEQIVTGQGTKVVSGGGYGLGEPTPDAATAIPTNDTDTSWAYVTGAVQVRRTSIIEAHAAINTTGGTAARNQSSYLAERPYVATWDCIVGAVQVSTRSSGPVS